MIRKGLLTKGGQAYVWVALLALHTVALIQEAKPRREGSTVKDVKKRIERLTTHSNHGTSGMDSSFRQSGSSQEILKLNNLKPGSYPAMRLDNRADVVSPRVLQRLAHVHGNIDRTVGRFDYIPEEQLREVHGRIRRSLRTMARIRATQEYERFASVADDLEADLTDLAPTPVPHGPVEVRGIWHRPRETSPHAIDHVLDRLAASGFNVIFLGVFWHGQAIWPGRRTYQHSMFSGQDVLHHWVQGAHARGLQVHAWMQMFKVAEGCEKGAFLTRHPAWAALQRDGELFSRGELGDGYLDPSHPEVRFHLLDAIKEVMASYAFDGLHLDSVRHPASDYLEDSFSYSPWSRHAFRALYGTDPLEITPTSDPHIWETWLAWQADQVTSFVAAVRDTMSQLWPHRILSAAVVGDPAVATTRHLQRWHQWVNEGLLDLVVPRLSGSTKSLVKQLQTLSVSDHEAFVVGGITQPKDQLRVPPAERVQALRETNSWGTVLHSLAALSEPDLDELADGAFRLKAVPPHHPQALYGLLRHAVDHCDRILADEPPAVLLPNLRLYRARLQAILADVKKWPLPYGTLPTRALVVQLMGRMRDWQAELQSCVRLVAWAAKADDADQKRLGADLLSELKRIEVLLEHHLQRLVRTRRML